MIQTQEQQRHQVETGKQNTKAQNQIREHRKKLSNTRKDTGKHKWKFQQQRPVEFNDKTAHIAQTERRLEGRIELIKFGPELGTVGKPLLNFLNNIS